MRSLATQLAAGRRLGKKPARFDSRTLKLKNYLIPKRLPPVPVSVDHYTIVPVSSWGMLGNDKKGDCVLASSAHHILSMTSVAMNNPHEPTESQVVSLYDQLSPDDTGLDILSILQQWQQTGLWGDKIGPYFQIQTGNRDEYKQANSLFGGIKIGLSLPDTNTFGPWIELQGPPDSANGHDVYGAGYNAIGPIVITWGAVVQMSWAFFDKYNDESFGVVSTDFLTTQGLTVDGFDWNQLMEDYQEVTGMPAPPPPPPPVNPPKPNCLERLVGSRFARGIARLQGF